MFTPQKCDGSYAYKTRFTQRVSKDIFISFNPFLGYNDLNLRNKLNLSTIHTKGIHKIVWWG